MRFYAAKMDHIVKGSAALCQKYRGYSNRESESLGGGRAVHNCFRVLIARALRDNVVVTI